MISKRVFVSARIRIVIHFGINPVSGGIPLNDKSNMGIITFMVLFEDSVCEMVEIYIVTFILNNKKSGVIIVE
jgi:hypothetical protein